MTAVSVVEVLTVVEIVTVVEVVTVATLATVTTVVTVVTIVTVVTVEGALVKALFHCKMENLKRLIKSLLFVEHTIIPGQGFYISSGWSLYSWIISTGFIVSYI